MELSRENLPFLPEQISSNGTELLKLARFLRSLTWNHFREDFDVEKKTFFLLPFEQKDRCSLLPPLLDTPDRISVVGPQLSSIQRCFNRWMVSRRVCRPQTLFRGSAPSRIEDRAIVRQEEGQWRLAEVWEGSVLGSTHLTMPSSYEGTPASLAEPPQRRQKAFKRLTTMNCEDLDDVQ